MYSTWSTCVTSEEEVSGLCGADFYHDITDVAQYDFLKIAIRQIVTIGIPKLAKLTIVYSFLA